MSKSHGQTSFLDEALRVEGQASFSSLPPQAERALAEADARRRETPELEKLPTLEYNGRGGLDPIRYGDWEVKGLTSDF